MPTESDVDAFVEMLNAQGIKFVRFEMADLHGVSRSKTVPIDKVARYALHGLNFYGGVLGFDSASSVVDATGLHSGTTYADSHLVPDFASFRRIPWLEDTGKVICDVEWPDGRPLAASPRHVLKGLVARARDLGFDVWFGHEFEFYLLTADGRAPLFGGQHIFNTVRNHYIPFLDEMIRQLLAIGIDIITHNCEYSGSQYETNFGPGVGVAAADKAFTFKSAVKELAHRAGYLATFMTKPHSDWAGSGGHVHVSLWDQATGTNAMPDPGAESGLSAVGESFAQGILDHGGAIMPLIGPTPNCYRRLKPHSFAPSNISWGVQDRTAMVRAKTTGDDRTHIEVRAGSAMANPYLSAAAVLAVGLLGVQGKAKLVPPSHGPAENDPACAKLPKSLDEALDALQADSDLCALLGQPFVDAFVAVKRFELARFHNHVTDWERKEYLELY